MYDKLKKIEERYNEISDLLCQPEIASNQDKLRTLGKEQADLQDLVTAFRNYDKLKKQYDDNQEIIDDGSDRELSKLAEEENYELKKEVKALEDKLKLLLVPKDPDDEKNAILEIRAGTGGDEAALFAMDLFQMYQRYAQNKGYKLETLSMSEASVGGVKEVVAEINGKGAYGLYRFESGTHRVQRVPKTETQGRIHTSAVTVAVLPEAEEHDVEISQNDLKIDVYRSSGPGGQSVNTTDSAVRITHLPTGLTVAMQDEKSQVKNRAKALKVLATRVRDHFVQEEKQKQDESRKQMVGSGDRSERIRTYNFPQGRVTDHRINLTLYSLNDIMLGELDELVNSLRQASQAEALASQTEDAG